MPVVGEIFDSAEIVEFDNVVLLGMVVLLVIRVWVISGGNAVETNTAVVV